MKIKKLLLFATILFLGLALQAQPYNNGIGIRLGNYHGNGGITFKHFMGGDRALEFIGHFPYHGFVIHGLYEFEKPINSVPNLNWLIGGGLFVANWDNYYYNKNKYHEGDRYTVFGLDFILGLEYALQQAPFTFQLDWKPSWAINGDYGMWGDDVSLSIRFTF